MSKRFTSAAEKTAPLPTTAAADQQKKRHGNPTTILFLDRDILSTIFSFLDMFDIAHCSLVCKFWNGIGSRTLREFYDRKLRVSSSSIPSSSELTDKALRVILGEVAMKQHRLALQSGVFHVDEWKGHSTRVAQCRMKMGMVVTGVGDKVIRLWSLDRYKCIEEYSIPEMFPPLVDFDFDESKIVGLIGSRLCIWRRNGKRSVFPSLDGKFAKGSCMRYFDLEAVVGYDDGAVRVFDMYSRRCSQIIRMHHAPITCLCVGEDQLILSASTSGSIAISDPSSVQQVATLRSSETGGIKTLCFNPSSQQLFAGSAFGYAYCWDLRTRRRLWEKRVSPSSVYSLHHLQNDKSTLAAGGMDGILRFLDQNDGNVVSSCVMENKLPSTFRRPSGSIGRRKGKRLPDDSFANIQTIPQTARPSITCLAVGMKKIVTTHNTNEIRVWKFKNNTFTL